MTLNQKSLFTKSFHGIKFQMVEIVSKIKILLLASNIPVKKSFNMNRKKSH